MGKWDHINNFITDEQSKQPYAHQKGTVSKKKSKRAKLVAQVKRPIKEFDYRIDSFLNYAYRSFVMPNKIIDNQKSSKYFYFALMNFGIFLLMLYLLGAFHLRMFNNAEGLNYVISGGTFALVAILMTYLIQMLALNRTNNFYKVFVDTISYYTLYNFFILLELVSIYTYPDIVMIFYTIRFLIIMIVPIKLFFTYKEMSKVEIDVFPLQIIFIVIMVTYIYITRDMTWLNFFKFVPME
ncbi:hypothetical protein [Macrococcus armenti]|uniref:hypothetical protein n=1 Tax=Macrococcus armenti TaxID=2875764 RepID=UPI001CCF8789|nr:hypothetical protein [Macrococcus armenti]UBH13976.1 hypothetical protein LAU43_04590 [Macrococcus armenti]UBH23208.1 hypothetical protein LAU42_04510 [Macrococcus armenti]